LDRTSVAAILKEVKEWVGWLGRGKHTVEYWVTLGGYISLYVC
jgi:hypothetical protein